MTRTLDRAIPTFTPLDNEMLSWPVTIHLLIEAESVREVWDELGVFWDDAVVLWDQDNLPGAMLDTACDLAGVDIEHGPADDNDLFPAGSLAATLVDPDGRYSRYEPDGTMTTWQIGKRIAVIVTLDGEDSWLFYGRVTSWTNSYDGTVEIEAFNLPHELTDVGPFTPGTNGQTVAQRLAAIRTVALVSDVLTRFDAGDVTLTAQPTTRSPWEEMQNVSTLSDGGLLFADVDDALVYVDRRIGLGRDDQTNTWVFSDNVCEGVDAVLWQAALMTSDDRFATSVRVTNIAGLVANKALVSNPYTVEHALTHRQPDQWTTQAEGDALANHLLGQRSLVLVDLDEVTLYVHDPAQNLWPMAVDFRLGDRFVFIHEYRSPGIPNPRFQVAAIVNLIRHSINPAEWVTTLGAWTYPLPLYKYDDAGAFYDAREVYS